MCEQQRLQQQGLQTGEMRGCGRGGVGQGQQKMIGVWVLVLTCCGMSCGGSIAGAAADGNRAGWDRR